MSSALTGRPSILFAVMAIIINFHMMKCTIEIPIGATLRDGIHTLSPPRRMATQSVHPVAIRFMW